MPRGTPSPASTQLHRPPRLPSFVFHQLSHTLATRSLPTLTLHLAPPCTFVLWWVEEGGLRVGAKRRGGDPLPQCQAQSHKPPSSGRPGCPTRMPHRESGTQTNTPKAAPRPRPGGRRREVVVAPLAQEASVRRAASADRAGRSIVTSRAGTRSRRPWPLRSGGSLGTRSIRQSPARIRSRVVNTMRSRPR